MNIIEISNDFCINYLACMRRVASRLNMTQSQALCLNAIPFNGISQSALAKKLSIDISTLSRNLDKLLASNVINKNSSSLDRRSFRIVLTDKGNDLHKNFLYYLTEEMQSIYSKLELDEVDKMEDILNKINWQLELLNK